MEVPRLAPSIKECGYMLLLAICITPAAAHPIGLGNFGTTLPDVVVIPGAGRQNGRPDFA